MTNLEKRPNRHALFGTAGIWLLLSFLFSFSSLLPQKKVYKTVKISLEAPQTPKIAPKQEAAPPKSEQKAEQPVSQSSPSAPEAGQSVKTSEAPKQNTKTAQKQTSKPSQKAPAKTAAASKPAQQKLSKSVDELIAEQRNSKKSSKSSTFDWDSFDDDSEVSSASAPSSSAVSAKAVDAFEGTAASTSKNTDSSAVSSSAAAKKSGAASSSTSSSLAKISSASYSSAAGNGVSSTATLKTASSPDGHLSLEMTDGSRRTLLEPSKPAIDLSDNAAATIDSSKNLTVRFTVLPNGHVDLNSISITPSAVISAQVQNEIKKQISVWRFNTDTVSATASFPYRIEKK